IFVDTKNSIIHATDFAYLSTFNLSISDFSSFFFFNDTATTEIYTLSLHDALPISGDPRRYRGHPRRDGFRPDHPDAGEPRLDRRDRKSTRLNSSHLVISYAVFCLKKKKIKK